MKQIKFLIKLSENKNRMKQSKIEQKKKLKTKCRRNKKIN